MKKILFVLAFCLLATQNVASAQITTAERARLDSVYSYFMANGGALIRQQALYYLYSNQTPTHTPTTAIPYFQNVYFGDLLSRADFREQVERVDQFWRQVQTQYAGREFQLEGNAAPSGGPADRLSRIVWLNPLTLTVRIGESNSPVSNSASQTTSAGSTQSSGSALNNLLNQLRAAMNALSAIQAQTNTTTSGTTSSGGSSQTSNNSCLITVNASRLNVRSNPSVSGTLVRQYSVGQTFSTLGSITGDNVEGSNKWWRTSDGYFVWAGGTTGGSNCINGSSSTNTGFGNTTGGNTTGTASISVANLPLKYIATFDPNVWIAPTGNTYIVNPVNNRTSEEYFAWLANAYGAPLSATNEVFAQISNQLAREPGSITPEQAANLILNADAVLQSINQQRSSGVGIYDIRLPGFGAPALGTGSTSGSNTTGGGQTQSNSPTITSVSPSTLTTAQLIFGWDINITGSGFSSGNTRVDFYQGTGLVGSATNLEISGSNIKARVPSHLGAGAYLVQVTVGNTLAGGDAAKRILIVSPF